MIHRYIHQPVYTRDAEKGKRGKDFIPGDLFRDTQIADTKEVEAQNEGKRIQGNSKESRGVGQPTLFD